MAEIRCPMCGKKNPDDLEICQFCEARLKPLIAAPSQDAPLHPGEEPVKKSTAEFEGVRTSRAASEEQPIHPGEEPTKKKTAELEQALPSWLRKVRGQKDQPVPEASDTLPAEESPPSESGPPSAPDSAKDQSRFDRPISDKTDDADEVPEWLTNLRGKAQAGGDELPEEEDLVSSDREDWLSRLGKPAEEEAEDLSARAGAADVETPPAITDRETPADFSNDRSGEKLPDWLAGLGAETEPEPTPSGTPEGDDVADWLASQDQQTEVERSDRSIDEQVPTPGSEAIPEGIRDEATPDWLTGFPAEDEGTASDVSEAQPPTTEQTSQSPEEKPDWLLDLQAKAVNSQEQEKESRKPPPVNAPDDSLPQESRLEEPVPEKPAEVEHSGEPSSRTPALIEEESAVSGHPAEKDFSMEVPEWLSDIKPESGDVTASAERHQTAERGKAEATSDLEPAELPSWVKAMRPVESVVDETQEVQSKTEGTVEEQGPLAGLMGVLPIEPGLGAIRKPPAYSIKIKMNESQQRHAEHLERLISAETKQKSEPGTTNLAAVRLLRWIVSIVLILAIGLPLLTGIQVAPPTSLRPPELMAALDVVSQLPPNAAVLLVFDYEPALSGELEATAAPMIDQLLFTGARLTLISTSPTGPILAERFLQVTQADHNYQPGQQYVNLGYLAGGPAGILNFAQNPPLAAPATIYGEQAWGLPPLQGVQSLRDFQLFILLTENADTARAWIEQAGSFLGESPVLMAISAQAEPMIRPYYDSRQVDGLVTGLAGGKSYEQILQRPGLAQTYWNAFSAGLFAAVLLIVCGSIWSVTTGYRERRGSVRKRGKNG